MPRFPPALTKYLKWDLRALRPWEWAATDAQDWTMAEAVHKEWRDGEKDADSFQW